MSYALVENGAVTQIGLPQTGTLKDGSTVSGYNLLEESVLLEEGWLPLVDIVPEYDAETQVVSTDGYTIESNQAIQKYKIDDKVTPPYVPSVEDRLAATEQALLAIMEVM